MSGWQPQQDDPRRAGGQPPQQWQQGPPPGYRPPPWQQQGYQQPQPQQVPYQRPEARRQHQRPREMNPYAGWVAFAVAMVVIVAGAAWYFTGGRPSAATASATSGAAASLAAVQPETEAGVRAAATQFYALYAAGQWAQAYAMLTAAAQAEVSESTYAAVHQGCPSSSAGLARVIKSVTLAGSTAVVTETVGGALSSLGSVTDAWDYSAGRWGIALSASSLKDYSHGSVKADVAAAKAAGQCAG
jgi:hypothetical protein